MSSDLSLSQVNSHLKQQMSKVSSLKLRNREFECLGKKKKEEGKVNEQLRLRAPFHLGNIMQIFFIVHFKM